MNNKILNVISKIRLLYPDDLLNYIYVGPDDRNTLNKGKVIKYINIYDTKYFKTSKSETNNKYKIKVGIIVNIEKDIIKLKSINSNFFWKIKMTENHIFYYDKMGSLINIVSV